MAILTRKEVIESLHRQTVSTLVRQGMPGWARAIVFDAAQKRGARLDRVVGRSRVFADVSARQAAMYEIKAAKPMLSATLIGRWFDRDHTTVLHAIACHQEANGLPRLSFYRLDRVRARNRHHAARQRAAMGRTLKQAR